MDKEHIRQRVRANGLRATASRIAVIERLLHARRPSTHRVLAEEYSNQ